MSQARISLGFLMLLGVVTLVGCSSNATSFVRDDVDYSYIRRVAIFPFFNRGQDLQAGARVYTIFQSEVLEQDALRTIDLGETMAGVQALRLDPTSELSPEQIVALGQELSVDAIFFGSVDEYGIERTSSARVYHVTFTFSLAETETGALIWQSQVHNNGTSVWRKIFGGGSASLHSVSQSAVQDALGTLF